MSGCGARRSTQAVGEQERHAAGHAPGRPAWRGPAAAGTSRPGRGPPTPALNRIPPGRSSPPPASERRDATQRSTPAAMIRASGRLIQNIARHPESCVSAPPITNPLAPARRAGGAPGRHGRSALGRLMGWR